MFVQVPASWYATRGRNLPVRQASHGPSEVVTRRYQANKPIVLTTNKRFAQWAEVFPNAACVVTLVDRLIHRCEVIEIDAESYRLKEAQERKAATAKTRAGRRTEI